MRTVSRLDKKCKGKELAHAESAQGDSAPKRLNAKTTNYNFVPYSVCRLREALKNSKI